MLRGFVHLLAAAVSLALVASDRAGAQSNIPDAFIEATLTDLGDPYSLVSEYVLQQRLAEEAQRRCDYEAWSAAHGRMLTLAQQVLAQMTREIAVLRPLVGRAPYYGQIDERSPAQKRAAERLKIAVALLRDSQRNIAKWSQRKFVPCEQSPRRVRVPGSPLGDTRVGQAPLVPLPQETGGFKNSFFDVGGSFAFVTLPQQGYLGSFNPVTLQETLGSFRTNRNLTLSGGSFNFEHGLGGGGPSGTGFSFFVYGSLQGMEGTNSSTGSFDPGPGNRTLFPGPEGGVSGVSLGGFPLNVVTDIRYRAEYSAAGGMLGFGSRFFVNPNVRVSIGGHAGYQNLNVEQTFAGAIPGFARTFAYETLTSVDNITFGLKSGIEWQTFPNIILSIKGHAGAARLNGSGTDTFVFTGLPTSTAGLSAEGTQFVGGASAGIRVTLPALSSFTTVRVAAPPSSIVVLGGEFGFERSGGFPTIFRNGTNRSQLQLSLVNALRARVSISVAY